MQKVFQTHSCMFVLQRRENMIHSDAIRALHDPPVKRVLAEVTLTGGSSPPSHTSGEKSQIAACKRAGPFKPLSSIHRQLSVILTGSSEEGSDGQMRARSRSLPQRQQRQSCVLLPTSHHLLLLSCPPPTASCRPSSLLRPQPIKSGHRLMEEMCCLQGPGRSLFLPDWLLLKHQGGTRKRNIPNLVNKSNSCIQERQSNIWKAPRNSTKPSCTERLHAAAAPPSPASLFFPPPPINSSFSPLHLQDHLHPPLMDPHLTPQAHRSLQDHLQPLLMDPYLSLQYTAP